MVMVKSAKVGPPKVPAYIVEGLSLTKRGREVRPVFLSKKDVDAALEKLGEEGKTAKVNVYDALGLLLSLAEDIEAGEPAVEAELASLEIVPPGESLDFREQLKRDKVARPPKIVPPDPRGPF